MISHNVNVKSTVKQNFMAIYSKKIHSTVFSQSFLMFAAAK